MRKTHPITIIIVLAVIAILAYLIFPKKVTDPKTAEAVTGCYVATNDKDVYTLKFQSLEGTDAFGTLQFKNFEKDSSRGTFEGTYKDGILLAKYSFQSEGSDSVMEVVFRREGIDFVRGVGEFEDMPSVVFDETAPMNLFKKVECV